MRDQVGWYLGDTTESLGFLAAGEVDVAVTYNDAAEKQAIATGVAVARVYGFRVGIFFSVTLSYDNDGCPFRTIFSS